MKCQFAQGYNNSANLSDFPYAVRLERAPEFDVEYTADGIGNPVGGASALLVWEYLETEEMWSLLATLGMKTALRSVASTVLLPDLYQIPRRWNAVATLNVPRPRNGWWNNVQLEFTAMELLS